MQHLRLQGAAACIGWPKLGPPCLDLPRRPTYLDGQGFLCNASQTGSVVVVHHVVQMLLCLRRCSVAHAPAVAAPQQWPDMDMDMAAAALSGTLVPMQSSRLRRSGGRRQLPT
jgi:hypothetical protein